MKDVFDRQRGREEASDGGVSERGKSFAVRLGFESDGQYKIYSDEMFYVEESADLYKHWPADVWQAIEQHEVKRGMDELQADFAVGMACRMRARRRTIRRCGYPNGGKALVVIYQGGKATEIKPGT